MNKIKSKNQHMAYELMVIFIFLNSLGFPGNYMLIFGDFLGTIVDYSCFFMEILMILFSSSDNFLDLKLIEIKKKYIGIYFFLIFVVVDSMMMTVSVKDEVITLVRLVVTALFALWLCDFFSVDQILEMFCLAHLIFMIATIIFTIFYPGLTIREYSSGIDYIGLFDSKNNCATEISLGFSMTILHYRNCKKNHKHFLKIYYPVMVIQLLLLMRCKSVGAWIVMSIPIIYILIIQKKVKILERIQIGWAFVVGSVSFLMVAITIIPVFSWFFEMVGKDATLTGRVPLWQHALKVMSQNKPLTGYGYGMFWRNEEAVSLIQQGFRRDSFLGNLTTGSHNLLIEMWMSIGLIGLALFFFMILYCFRKCQEIEESAYLFCCTFFMVFTIKGMTERLLSTAYTYDVLMLFLTLALGCSKRTNIKPPWKRLHCQEYSGEEKKREEK